MSNGWTVEEILELTRTKTNEELLALTKSYPVLGKQLIPEESIELEANFAYEAMGQPSGECKDGKWWYVPATGEWICIKN